MQTTIRIKDLALRTIIGLNDWERHVPQEVLVSIAFTCEGGALEDADSADHLVDYRSISKRVIAAVEGAQFHLLEALAARVLEVVLETSERIEEASVEVDKPHSLRYARSVSASVTARRRR